MTIADIKNHVQLRLEDPSGNVYTLPDITRAIDSALQKIPALLDKQYLSRLLHQQQISTGTSDSSTTQTADNYLSDGSFLLEDLTNSNKISGQYGYELAYDQIESAFLIPNSIANLGASITESIVWIHITDQLGRYELENSYMYTPNGDSPVFVRSGGNGGTGSKEVEYQILPVDLFKYGKIFVMYYMKPPKVSNISTREPEISSVAHEALVYFAVSELLASDGDMNRSNAMYQRASDIVATLNAKVSNMDVTKKQSQI
jgi:hypothetical protein